jgi:hypothetical protein
MTVKSAFFGAALAAGVLGSAGAQATSYVQITIAGAGDPTTVFIVPASPTPNYYYTDYSDYPFSGFFVLGPITAITNGSPVTDTYYFFTFADGGGLADTAGYYNILGRSPDSSYRYGIQIYTGPESHPTFTSPGFWEAWGPVFYNSYTDHYDTISISLTSVPEPSTWVMMLAGFTALGFAAARRKAATLAA